MNLEQKLEQQVKSGNLAGAYLTNQEIKFQLGLVSKQELRNASVRSASKPKYVSDFDSFVLENTGDKKSSSSVNIKGHSTVASPRGLGGSMEVVKQNSTSNLI